MTDNKARDFSRGYDSSCDGDVLEWCDAASDFIESQRRTIEEKDGEIERLTIEKEGDANRIDDLQAKVEQLQARVREWQPIESAPNDGTEIIVFIPEAYSCVEIVSWQLNEFHGDHWMRARCVDEGYAGNPTHWMPLPKPPIITTGEKKP